MCCSDEPRAKLYQEAVQGERDPPDKEMDSFTTSLQFRRDLARLGFTNLEETVLEVGAYRGYLTRTLSRLFRQVIAIDAVEAFLRENMRLNEDLQNVEYVMMDVMDETSWPNIVKFNATFAIIDAAEGVYNILDQIDHIIQLGTVRWLILANYHLPLVASFVHRLTLYGLLRPVSFLGLRPGMNVHGQSAGSPEALFVEVLSRDRCLGELAPISGVPNKEFIDWVQKYGI
jgi:hypothetical protein